MIIVILSDEVIKMKILLLCFDRLVAIDTYPEVVKKMYFLLLLPGM